MIFSVACSSENEKKVKSDQKEVHSNEKIDSSDARIRVETDTINVNLPPDTLEQRLIDSGLVNIQDLIPDILVDVKYNSSNNFMDTNIYGNLPHIYLQPEVAKRLKKSQQMLKSKDSTLTLLVYDGVRPVWVQQFMWNHLDMPLHEKTKFVSNPKNGSLHNYGCAVDLTIANLEGEPLDMGAGYDDVRKIAYPSKEAHFLETGELTEKQVNNRKLLRAVMSAGGFWNIQTEWWHFNAYSRPKAKELYAPVL